MSTAVAIMPNTQTSGEPGNNCFPFAASSKAPTRKIKKPMINAA